MLSFLNSSAIRQGNSQIHIPEFSSAQEILEHITGKRKQPGDQKITLSDSDTLLLAEEQAQLTKLKKQKQQYKKLAKINSIGLIITIILIISNFSPILVLGLLAAIVATTCSWMIETSESKQATQAKARLNRAIKSQLDQD